MVGKQHEDGTLRLSVSTWLSIIGLIVVAIGANYTQMWAMQHATHTRIDALDDKWQVRILEITRELKTDMTSIRNSIPPDWFRTMVDSNTRSIQRLEEQLEAHERDQRKQTE